MKLELFYPVKPFHLNQRFGDNPSYYSKFKDSLGNSYLGHNGWDFMAVHGQPIYAPIDGVAMYTIDSHGGQSVLIRSNQPLEYSGGACWFNVIHGHVIGDTDLNFPPPIPMNLVRTPVKIGQLIAYADNTGAPYESSGDHLHFGLVPVDMNGKPVTPGNGYNGAIDPRYYFNKYYAEDATKIISIYQRILNLLKSFIQ